MPIFKIITQNNLSNINVNYNKTNNHNELDFKVNAALVDEALTAECTWCLNVNPKVLNNQTNNKLILSWIEVTKQS